MSPDPHHPSGTAGSGTTAPRPAVWPWLLLPLVVLAMFFALRAVTPAPRHAANAPATVESAAPTEVSESP
jgi:hypothetical protein